MLRVPVSVQGVLPRLIEATRLSGYAGMMVVLARTADARRWLDELTGDWASFHDVTGPFVAVVCPEPYPHVDINDDEPHRHAKVNGFGLALPPGLASLDYWNPDSFAQQYKNTRRNDRDRDIPRVRLPFSAGDMKLLQDAWSQVTSRCAAHFGFTEEVIPAVLIMSLREQIALLVRLPKEASLYALCKEITTGLGDSLCRIDELRAEQAQLKHSLPRQIERVDYDPPPRLSFDYDPQKHLADKVPGQLAGLDRHLEVVTDADPELVARWRAKLATVNERFEVAEAMKLTSAIAAHVKGSADRVLWRKLDRKVSKVMASIDALERKERRLVQRRSMIAEWERGAADRLRQRRAAIADGEARLAVIPPELEALESNLKVADAVQAAAERLLGDATVTIQQGKAGLSGWQLRILQRSRPRLRWNFERA